MSERGKAQTLIVAAGSNTSVKSTPGTLYRILSTNPSGSTVRVEGGDMGTTVDFNTYDATDTIANVGGALLDFGPGVSFEKLTVAATSNARLTVVYE